MFKQFGLTYSVFANVTFFSAWNERFATVLHQRSIRHRSILHLQNSPRSVHVLHIFPSEECLHVQGRTVSHAHWL